MRGFNPAIFLGAFVASAVLTAAGFSVVDCLIVMVVVALIYVAVVGMLNARTGR